MTLLIFSIYAFQGISNNFILVLFILLITDHTVMTIFFLMPSAYRCPACGSDDVIDQGEVIECRSCRLEFFKEFLEDEIDEENLLSEQELKAFADAFDEDEKKKIVRSLEEDVH